MFTYAVSVAALATQGKGGVSQRLFKLYSLKRCFPPGHWQHLDSSSRGKGASSLAAEVTEREFWEQRHEWGWENLSKK